MAAALFRVTTERKTPNAAIATSGTANTPSAAKASPSERPVDSVVPLSPTTGLKPQAMPPEIRPAASSASNSATTYVNEARVLPARIWRRRSDRVRIIFSVPPASSVATMSPATSAVTSWAPKREANVSTTSDSAMPVCRRLCPSGTSYGPPFWKAMTLTNRIGRSAAAPMPMYVRFWATSFRTSQR